MTDLDDLLRQGMHEATTHITEPDAHERARRLLVVSTGRPPDSPTQPRPRRRRPRVVALAAALLVLAALGALVLTRTGDDGPQRVTVAPATRSLADAGPGWHQLDTGPVPPMSPASTAWTGTELIVAGPTREGVQFYGYSPAAETWRRLADPPVDFVDALGSSWTGDVLLVVDGSFPAATAAAYDPATDTWHDTGPPPVAPSLADAGSAGLRPAGRSGAALVWTGERVLDLTHGSAWDPDDEAWSTLSFPEDPVAYTGLLYTNPVWDGTEVVAVAWSSRPGLAWNATGTQHREVEPMPVDMSDPLGVNPGLTTPAVAVSFDDRVLLVAGDDQGLAASVDARTGTWRREPAVPGMARSEGCPAQAIDRAGTPTVRSCAGGPKSEVAGPAGVPLSLGDSGWTPLGDAPDVIGRSWGPWLDVDGVLLVWSSTVDDQTDVDPQDDVEAHYWVPER